MEPRIRQAGIEDAAAIAQVQVASWRTTYAGIVPDEFLVAMSVELRTSQWQEQFQAADSLIFVAEDSSEVFGFISGGRLREAVEDYDAELYAIYLLQARQGQGIGRKLTCLLAEKLREQGMERMLVWALEQNPAVSFYKRLGAVPVLYRQITISGAVLPDLALGWRSLDRLLTSA